MKILILSNTPWSNNNSFGNSFSNIFEGIESFEFANIYCRYGEPQNNLNIKYFQITEMSLIKNLINCRNQSGKEILKKELSDDLSRTQYKIFNHVRKIRFQIYFWMRDLIWTIGRWKSPDLLKFINEFDPDIIFQPVYYSIYLNDIALFIKKFTKVPMVCYVSDDVYTLRQFSLSSFYWINRFLIRSKVRRIIEQCEYLYVISEIQKKEYEKCFGKECKVLTKGSNFKENPIFNKEANKPLKLVYTGNIYGDRWKMLVLIGKNLDSINESNIRAKLIVYTMTPITKKIKKSLIGNGNIVLMGGVSYSQIEQIQRNADILVHVESFGLKERLQVHQSLSTKIVDYFSSGRCIFAIGSSEIASIDYLKKNDAAVIATSKSEILKKINSLVNDTSLIDEYSKKAWKCGKNNHEIDIIQNGLYNDLNLLVKEARNENITD
ncbi:MAG: glycosyltransferase [Bacteroidetes bacterium]|nr:glycosyltransferase [Bacteroidota bacterium]